ncbi:tubulin-specific chaperone E [Phymastichus coffea]|uniref:tubulin-specific chaperone E n=1 Tax=Phymastichus coffea TaxID=108790 RepID=UPI00273C09E2|nr:tubulin-specific chaperone E [Phymastichus coffea]
MIEDKNCIGSRVGCEGHIGTVKYVGTVGDTKGQWLGIDWDDPSRGKHNGTYEGVEYFQTWHLTSGSFIRPGKANFGISCPEAIKVRYGFVDDELAGIDRETIASVQKSLNAPFVEMVGFSKVNKKQSTFNQLKIVCLHNQCVSSAGHSGELAALCPIVEELDLSHNLVNSWRVIADICVQLRNLIQLNVSQNYLPIEDVTHIPDDAFINLSHLTMGRMKYDWCIVIKYLTLFPSIRELIVSFNIIQTIDYIPINSNVMKLTGLSLENNLINDWNEILKLGKLPCLRNLNLNSNKIREIWFPTNEATDKTSLFINLLQLHISDNSIENWRSISELEKLKCLEDLKFRENPVLQQQSLQTGIQLVIARIATLKYLNGTEIDRSERLGAEYDYLKLFALEWKNVEQDIQKRKEFIVNHPRFLSLIERIGVPDTPEIKNTQLSSNVITVEFICPDDPNIKRIKKKLLKNMDVQKLMGIVQRLFKIHGKIPVLSFVRPSVSEDEIPLDKPLQELSYYLIDDGDLIFVRW